MTPDRCITIIGGGFSGTLTAVQLLRQSPFSLKVRLINSGYPVARGVAYSAESTYHLLNVRAGRMSAFPHLPRHFVNWLETQPEAQNFCEPGQLLADAFMPRQLYGRYIESILENTLQNLPAGSRLEMIDDEVTGLESNVSGRYALNLKKSGLLLTDKVVLALGNFAPAPVPGIPADILESKHYSPNPWLPGALENLHPDLPLLLVGTGLTMIDVVLSLLNLGFKGKILTISPKGYLPLVHLQGPTYTDFRAELKPPYILNQIFGSLKDHIKRAHEQGSSCEALIDSLRPKTQDIWRGLPENDKLAFLRHLNPLWTVFRHRIAPQIADQIQAARDSNQLEVMAARLKTVTVQDEKLIVGLKFRGKQQIQSVEVQRIVNCTGPQSNYTKIAHPLVQQLVSEQLIQPDSLHLGLEALPDGRLIQADGNPSCTLFTIGPALRSVLWESTAVPEISAQAAHLAQTILHTFFPGKLL